MINDQKEEEVKIEDNSEDKIEDLFDEENPNPNIFNKIHNEEGPKEQVKIHP